MYSIRFFHSSTEVSETVVQILQKQKDGTDNKARKNIINVDRDDVMDGCKRAFMRPRFNPKAGLDVKFVGEEGIDNGGLSSELLRLLLNEVRHLSIFTGPEYARNLVLDQKGVHKCFQSKKYLALTLVHTVPLLNIEILSILQLWKPIPMSLQEKY